MGAQLFPSLRLMRGAEGEEKKAVVEQLTESLVLLDEAFEKCSKGKPFFGGDGIGYIDIALGSILGWLRVTEKISRVKLLDEAKTPRLVKWADRFCADGAVKDVMPETDKLIEFNKMLMAKMKGAPPKQ
ncbi:Glutathione S-transferase U18 [Morella rubra]|uniref:Glutathione S-transferase U18 n=1 Tax=Morella rubra TaxID=262757 RepID=A0A6A1V6E5_9ROSI|nr:Glutathione S-transferase U18 [Morella rubra]